MKNILSAGKINATDPHWVTRKSCSTNWGPMTKKEVTFEPWNKWGRGVRLMDPRIAILYDIPSDCAAQKLEATNCLFLNVSLLKFSARNLGNCG